MNRLTHTCASLAMCLLAAGSAHADRNGTPGGPAAAAGPEPAERPASRDEGGARSPGSVATDAYIESLIRAVGAPTQPRPITLAEAIASAVRNNPGLLADSRAVDQALLDVIQAAAIYDPRIHGETSLDNSRRLSANRIETGVGPQTLETLDEESANLNVGVSKLLRYGTQVDVAWNNGRQTSNAAYQILSPQHDPSLGVSVSQPLLKNFGGLRERTRVLLARNTTGQVAAGFATTLANFVTTVVDAYWNYALAESELEVARQAVALSTELAQETERRVNAGTLAPVAVSEARADVAAREEQRIRAENALDLAARTLQYRVMYGAVGEAAPEPVRPAERHAVGDVTPRRNEALRIAVEKRPEVRNARLVLQASHLREQVARNDLLPDLSIVGSYSLLGLGGEPVDKNEADSYGEALDRMTRGKYYDYGVGLRVEVPLSNAQARAQHDREVIQVQRDEEQLRQVVSDVALEVERTVGDVISARERVAAAKVARELAEENLRNQRRRYEVGLVTTTDVLQYQDRLIRAMASEVGAVADHARSEALLARAEGTLLDQYGIDLSYEDLPDLPWWAKF